MATHRQVLQWLENELFDGHLVLGQQLPSDRDLAAIHRVSRNTMREALKTLEAQGIVRLFDGPRKSILPMLVREPAASAGPALQLHMATSDYPLRDIVQTRVLLETWALERSDPEHPAMAELRALLEQMARDDLSLKEFHHLEVSFHIALCKTAGNSVVSALMSSLRDSIYEYTMALVGHVPLWSATSERLRAEHQAIYSAVAAGDRRLASRLVAEHIEYQYREAGVDPDQEQRTPGPAPDAPAELNPPGAAAQPDTGAHELADAFEEEPGDGPAPVSRSA